MPRGSFLDQPVTNPAQLATLVRKDPRIAARYAAHFGVPVSAIADYMQKHLALRPLSRAGKYRIFFVRNDGSIGEEVRYLPKGRKVFVHLPTQQPVLLGDCGNPLTAELPGYAPQRAEEANIPVVLRPEETTTEPLPEPMLEPPVVTAAHPVLPEPAPLPEPQETLMLTVWESSSETSAEAELAQLDGLRSASSNDEDFLLVPLLFVALLGAIEGTHSSPPPFVIPEPATMASLAAGMTLLAVWERRRRNRTR